MHIKPCVCYNAHITCFAFFHSGTLPGSSDSCDRLGLHRPCVRSWLAYSASVSVGIQTFVSVFFSGRKLQKEPLDSFCSSSWSVYPLWFVIWLVGKFKLYLPRLFRWDASEQVPPILVFSLSFVCLKRFWCQLYILDMDTNLSIHWWPPN